MPYEQPKRSALDGPISAHRVGSTDLLELVVETQGVTERITCTEYNASRLFAALAILLGVRINAQDAKAIKL